MLEQFREATILWRWLYTLVPLFITPIYIGKSVALNPDYMLDSFVRTRWLRPIISKSSVEWPSSIQLIYIGKSVTRVGARDASASESVALITCSIALSGGTRTSQLCWLRPKIFIQLIYIGKKCYADYRLFSFVRKMLTRTNNIEFTSEKGIGLITCLIALSDADSDP